MLSPSDFWHYKIYAQITHTQNFMQHRLQGSGQDITGKEMWPLNSPKLNPMDYHIWGIVRDLSPAEFKT